MLSKKAKQKRELKKFATLTPNQRKKKVHEILDNLYDSRGFTKIREWQQKS